jgi:hypothetical protein
MGKLVVAFPDLFPPLTKEDGVLGADSARGLLRLYLAYFASLDDDARLAYSILARRGLPRHSSGMDIKGNWGIIPPAGPLSVQVKCPNVFPDAIPASEALQLELAESMYEGLTLQPQGIEPSWMPSAIPSNYVQMVRRVTTHLAPGIGEISAGIAFYRDTPVFFAPSENDPSDVTLSPDWLPAARAARLVEKLRPYTIKFRPLEEEFILIANKRLSLNDMLKIRDILVKSEVFPLWFLSDVRPDSFERWRARIDKITPRPFSKIIYTSKVR